MYLRTFKCYQISSNLNKLKIQVLCLFFLFIFSFVFSQQQIQANSKETFTHEFFSNKRVHYILKEHLKKNKITILDKDSLITNKPLDYSNERIKLAIDNKHSNADLFVQYYIINQDLAYVSLWGNINAVSFTFAKKGGKWIFFDYSIRETR
ncbi:hypothetical protein [Chryseobacterium mucoviscidosis]|uniref:hypothetical protein n=1 Tax=Chryseobacterium mucoviscidosis TaxID=1945581 RepID=UPI000ECAB793|nr:hypothetical protein [Chryseobacterium sp.]